MAELEHLGGKRAESARVRRAEQLRRWRGSQTQQEPAERQPRTRRGGPRVRFEDGAVFLAACSSGDTDEVKRLLARGADINTTNVDGLTALHQICYLMCPQINLEMKGRVRVELSVSQPGSDAVERLGWLCRQGQSSACAACSLSPVLSYRDSWAWTQGHSVKEMVETDWRSRGTRSPSALPGCRGV
ncbi:protein phosphatase 1 regulatory subunit 12B [Rhinolophus ferrumequinum]|uniref:Protein phosphatase 1 regulatory subunit 12B n=1 Tax=Rhinolophus ferrumequinum TaxID=59479 RepID=A0A7J7RF28_RHIFE|nr:protein phosphatase 1 regulatory subunit 12B [Rhinolophus ferrumequinum]